METIKKDLTVIGAGLAGVCAAIMAARKGLTVALIGDRPVLGGNSSSEMRMWTRGATGGENLYSEEMGILGEMKLTNLYRNRDANIIFWDEILFDFVFAEQNISLYLNTHVAAVEMTGKSLVRRVQGDQLGSEKKFRFESPVFIDATGDGTVGYLAGADFTVGREGKELYGERFAPEKSDPYGLGSSLFFYSKKVDSPVTFVPPEYAYSKDDMAGLLGSGGRIVNEHMSGTDFWWLEYGGTRDTIRDNQDITIELKKIVYGIWDYIKNSGQFDSDYLTLEWVGSLPCKRESRRLKGEYIVKQQDLEERKYFPDGVCYGGWYMDFHPPEGIYSKEEFCEQTPVSVYAIPMRSLYTRNIDNLLFAGRIISVTHAAFSSTRIMNTCALNGQAVGMIAAYMVQNTVNHHTIYEEKIADLQQDLLQNDMFIPGVKNEQPGDHAKTAEVTASSTRPLLNCSQDMKISLHDDFYLLFPGLPETGAISLQVDCETDSLLQIDFLPCEYPAGFRPSFNNILKSITIKLDAGQFRWVAVPGIVDNENSYYMKINANPHIKLSCSSQSFTGFIGRFRNSKKLYHPCFQAENSLFNRSVCGPENIKNGFNRPYGMPNIWMSDSVHTSDTQWIELSWRTPQCVSEVRLFFNPDLSMELVNSRGRKYADHHGFTPRETMPPELIKSYRILAKNNSDFIELARNLNNMKRMVVHQFPDSIETVCIRIEFLETWGSSFFELFEVRVF